MFSLFFTKIILLSHLSLTVVLKAHPKKKQWVDSTDGIHAFLTFDSGIRGTWSTYGLHSVDYVWGSSWTPQVYYNTTRNKNAVISHYIPFQRDPDPTHNLDYWQKTHPSFILYQCDRKTPATYPDSPKNMPLDISNPEVVKWQLNLVTVATTLGYDAIAWDNFGLNNYHHACGSYSGPNNEWVQLYTGEIVDSNFTQDVIRWLEQIYKMSPLLTIPNFCLFNGPAWDSTIVLKLGNSTDGVLSEGGFTGWGTHIYTPAQWQNVLNFMTNLQAHGKAYYSINEVGPPGGTQHEITKAQRLWIIASYLMGKNQASGIYISCSQCYGNWSWWNEYEADVGSPVSNASQIDSTLTVWKRLYTKCVVYVNTNTNQNVTIKLDAGYEYVDMYGVAVTSPMLLTNHSGEVLFMKKILNS